MRIKIQPFLNGFTEIRFAAPRRGGRKCNPTGSALQRIRPEPCPGIRQCRSCVFSPSPWRRCLSAPHGMAPGMRFWPSSSARRPQADAPLSRPPPARPPNRRRSPRRRVLAARMRRARQTGRTAILHAGRSVPEGRHRRQSRAHAAGARLLLVLGADHRQILAFTTLNRKARASRKASGPGVRWTTFTRSIIQRTDQPFTAVFVAALREWKRSFEGGPPREAQLASVKERVEKAMNVSIQREVEKIERGLGYLATVGSHRALRRPVRHRLGHHDRVSGDRRAPRHDASRWSRRASPTRCSRPRSVWSRRSLRSSPITASSTSSAATPDGWNPSPTNSRPSYRASSTRGRADARGDQQSEGGARRTRRQARRTSDVGDQRHALCRRDAGAAHRLHGDGAPCSRWACRSICRRRARNPSARTASRSRSPSTMADRFSCRIRPSASTSWCRS